VFTRKFWNRLRFTDEEEIDAEIKQFNLEYEKYTRLVGNNIDPEAVEHKVLPDEFELPKQYEKAAGVRSCTAALASSPKFQSQNDRNVVWGLVIGEICPLICRHVCTVDILYKDG